MTPPPPPLNLSSMDYLASYLVCQAGTGGDCVLAVSDWLSLNLVECQEWGLLMGSFRLERGQKQTGWETRPVWKTECSCTYCFCHDQYYNSSTSWRICPLLAASTMKQWFDSSEHFNLKHISASPEASSSPLDIWNIPFEEILSESHVKKTANRTHQQKNGTRKWNIISCHYRHKHAHTRHGLTLLHAVLMGCISLIYWTWTTRQSTETCQWGQLINHGRG